MPPNDDYYYGNQPHITHSPSPASHIDPRLAPTSHSSPAPPSYRSEYAPSSAPYPPDHHSRTDPSPFDTVFDDHAYPSRPSPPAAASSSASAQDYYPHDTGYYGQQGRPDHSLNDIALQERHGKNGPDPEIQVNDHIYDTPQGIDRTQSHHRRRRSKVAFGQLGMFGSDKKRIPFVVYIFSAIQIAVFIAEIVKNSTLTGSPIMTKPQFNPMIGPSPQVMINMGARYVPCMHNVDEIQGSDSPVLFLCPNATALDQTCPLSTLCGFGADSVFDGNQNPPAPNQWFRFIIPIFMHAGLVHIGFNLIMQLTIGKDMERAIGSIRFFLVYMSAGIFGFVLGGNYAAPGIASTGASGSLFGVLALVLLDLLYSWRERKNPVKDLMFIILNMVVSFVLGLLPGLDNFSHIGGFLMGLCLGVSVLHSPNALRLKIGEDVAYATVPADTQQAAVGFLKNPVGFFKGRKPLWWAWWLVRAGALILVIVVFIVLLNNFYVYGQTCSWCKYLTCIDINGWCDIGVIQKPPVQ